MDIVIHSHHAEVSEFQRKRAERAVERAAARIPSIVEGIIRFEEDGPTRRVTITLRAPKHHDLMGKGEDRFFGPALTAAVARLNAQADREKRSHGRRGGTRNSSARG